MPSRLQLATTTILAAFSAAALAQVQPQSSTTTTQTTATQPTATPATPSTTQTTTTQPTTTADGQPATTTQTTTTETKPALTPEGAPAAETTQTTTTQTTEVTKAAKADFKTGVSVYGQNGELIGTLEAVKAESAVVNTGKTRAEIPSASFGKNDKGLVLGITKAELDAKADAKPKS